MESLLVLLEHTPLSVWVRESPSMFAFPGILVLHTIGMAFLAGTTSAFSIRVLGFAQRVPVAELLKFAPIAWAGLIVNAVSGILLLLAYPAKALTNPVFYIKMGAIALALVAVRALARRIATAGEPPVHGMMSPRSLAGATLFLWVVSVTAGRLLAYTHSVLLVGDF